LPKIVSCASSCSRNVTSDGHFTTAKMHSL
jgi:hypothetical protein